MTLRAALCIRFSRIARVGFSHRPESKATSTQRRAPTGPGSRGQGPSDQRKASRDPRGETKQGKAKQRKARCLSKPFPGFRATEDARWPFCISRPALPSAQVLAAVAARGVSEFTPQAPRRRAWAAPQLRGHERAKRGSARSSLCSDFRLTARRAAASVEAW